MSLDDKFNPNDGSLPDKIDSLFYGINKKIAEKWVDATGESVETLITGLYALTVLGETIYGLTKLLQRDYNNAIAAFAVAIYPLARIKYPYAGKSRSGLEGELQAEMLGIPRKSFKLFEAYQYVFGAGFLMVGAGATIAGYLAADKELIEWGYLVGLIGGSLMAWQSANYMSRIDYNGPPPNKKIQEKSRS